jgi:hypothetical protein
VIENAFDDEHVVSRGDTVLGLARTEVLNSEAMKGLHQFVPAEKTEMLRQLYERMLALNDTTLERFGFVPNQAGNLTVDYIQAGQTIDMQGLLNHPDVNFSGIIAEHMPADAATEAAPAGADTANEVALENTVNQVEPSTDANSTIINVSEIQTQGTIELGGNSSLDILEQIGRENAGNLNTFLMEFVAASNEPFYTVEGLKEVLPASIEVNSDGVLIEVHDADTGVISERIKDYITGGEGGKLVDLQKSFWEVASEKKWEEVKNYSDGTVNRLKEILRTLNDFTPANDDTIGEIVEKIARLKAA